VLTESSKWWLMLGCQLIANLFAGIQAYPLMKAGNFTSIGTIVFWVIAACVVVSAVLALSTTRKSSVVGNANSPRPPEIALQSTILDARSTDPTVTYKAKVRIIFTNQTGETISVLSPSWTTGVEDVSTQYPFGYRYQLEATLGSWKKDLWSPQELTEAEVRPGWSFRVYVGLDPSLSHGELERRKNTHRLGTLLIPIKVGPQEHKWEARV
jgi:hypothetical protein